MLRLCYYLWTIIITRIIFHFREVVELILGRGFDINVRTARGTALHEAAVCGKKDVVKYLLESNVNLELRDRDDKTVLEVMDDLNTPMTREVIHLVLGKIEKSISNSVFLTSI